MMQQLAEQISSWAPLLASLMPVTQEVYLFFFFCLGFAIFRTDAIKRRLSWNAKNLKAKAGAPAASEQYSVQHLRADFHQRRYERVLQGWSASSGQRARLSPRPWGHWS